MRPPIFIRPLTEDEQHQVQAGLRSSDAFVLLRCQILLASARKERVPQIALQLGCDDQTVRNVIHGFNASGLDVLRRGSSRPHRLRTSFTPEGLERLYDLLHHSPREWDFERGTWTLELVAQVCLEQGISTAPISDESVRRALQRLGTTWKRAKHWVTSPDPLYLQKKNARDKLIAWASQHPTWATGFLDEVWWSRFAQPRLHAWQDEDHPVRLMEQTWHKNDPDPKALACYGVLWQTGSPEAPQRDEMWLRFVTGRPVSEITTQFLDWCCQRLEAQGKTTWLLIWDNASWHISKSVKSWIREHNQQVKQTAKGVRILPFRLPSKSPWLNPIEPRWVHGKRAIVEPNGLLSAQQLAERVCSHFGCSYEPHLSIPEKVA